MHHRIGHLLPRDGAAPAFAQIYFYAGSTEEQVALRGSAISSGLNPIILGKLQTILNDINPLAATYRSAREYADSTREMCLVLFEKPNTDPRRYNRPTAEEVAAIMTQLFQGAMWYGTTVVVAYCAFLRLTRCMILSSTRSSTYVVKKGGLHMLGTSVEFARTTTQKSAFENTLRIGCT
ncbi:hypothetical protein PC128_g5650 [Phytophthora cactorum]|nr:hypothetical protein PC128_g5650 [Phytophthora cactorum]